MDPKGACFLCLHDISCSSSSTENFETSLQIIFRYLKIDPSAFTPKSSTSKDGLPGQIEEEEFKNLGISLCPICASHSKHLSNLILQLERIQKCVMRKLQVFKDAMSGHETSPSHLARCQDEGLAGSSGNEEKTLLLEALRQETKDKSSTTWLNLLRLMKPKPPAIQSAPEKHRPLQQIPSSSSVVRGDTTTPTLNNNLDVTNYSGLQPQPLEATTIMSPALNGSEFQSDIQTESSSQISSTEKWVTDVISNKTIIYFGGRVYRCPFCHIQRSRTMIQAHLAVHHLDQIFADRRGAAMSPRDFTYSCARALRALVEELGVLQDPTSANTRKERHSFLCSICQTIFSAKEEFKGHLVLKHSNKLENNLSSILANPTGQLNSPRMREKYDMSRIMKRIAVKKYPKGRHEPISEDGKRVLRHRRSVTSDQNVANPTKKRPPYKFKNLSTSDNPLLSETFKKLCERAASGYSRCGVCKEVRVATKILLSKHLVNTHPEEFLSQVKLPEISEENFKSCCHHILNETSESASLQVQESGENFHLCPICSDLAFPNHYDLKYHFVLEHFQDFQGKLSALQQKAMAGSIQFMDQVEEDPLNVSGVSDHNEDVDENDDDGSIDEEEMLEMSSYCEVKIKTEDLAGEENVVAVEEEEDGIFMESEDAIGESEERKPIIESIYSMGVPTESILPDL